MSLIKYLHHWLLKPDYKKPISIISTSLIELEREEILSERGKNLLIEALTNVNLLKELLLPPSNTQTDSVRMQETILLAEADQDMREYLRENLSKDYLVTCVEHGAKALETAKESNPDIIISSILLPDLRGYDLCRILKSSIETSHIPIILLSALNDKENIIFGLEAGASDYIVKPFDFDILKVRIRTILQSRAQLRKSVFLPDTPIEETDYTNDLDIKFLDKTIHIIEKDINNPNFSVEEFCRSLAMSRTLVFKKLKTLTGQSPRDFIRIFRLNKAKELLESGKYTVSEVAYKVGFTTPKYFTTSFKKQFGINPNKVKK